MIRTICSRISMAVALLLAAYISFPAQRPNPQPGPTPSKKILSSVLPNSNDKILDIKFQNPPFDTSGQSWSKSVCSDGVWLHGSTPNHEWIPILNPQLAAEDRAVGITGIAINPHQSGTKDDFGDVWFTHPFGSDWNVDVVWESNPNYDYLIAPRIKPDEDQDARAIAAIQTGITNARALHVEMDSGFIAPHFRAIAGDSVAVFGRWVVDCGHDNFQAEIHPPLMFVKAQADNDGISTRSTVISRPFLVSQEFEDGSLYDHLIKQIGIEAGKSLVPSPVPIVINDQITARPKILQVPFSGIHVLTYLVRPPIKNPGGKKLAVSYRFTIRTGVSVQISNVGDDDGTVMVMVVLNDSAYKPASLPQKENWHVSIGEIGDHENLDYYLKGVQKGITNLIGNPYLAAVIQKGVDTDHYQLPTIVDAPNSTVYASDIRGNTNVTVDDSQPFPIRGSVDVNWATDPRTVVPTNKTDPKTVVPPKKVDPRTIRP